MASIEADKPQRDRHPEISAPIIDLSLEARIARAERAVVERDERVRGGAARVESILRTRTEKAATGAAIAAAIGIAALAGYEGYKALRRRKGARVESAQATEGEARPFAAQLLTLADVAHHWMLALQGEKGMAGFLVGMLRKLGCIMQRHGHPGHPGSAGTPRADVRGFE